MVVPQALRSDVIAPWAPDSLANPFYLAHHSLCSHATAAATPRQRGASSTGDVMHAQTCKCHTHAEGRPPLGFTWAYSSNSRGAFRWSSEMRPYVQSVTAWPSARHSLGSRFSALHFMKAAGTRRGSKCRRATGRRAMKDGLDEGVRMGPSHERHRDSELPPPLLPVMSSFSRSCPRGYSDAKT